MRPSVALIYTAMAVISASVAAIVHRMTGFPLETSILLAALVFFALCAVDQAVSRANERKSFQNQLELSDHAIQDAMNEIDMIRSRMVSLETDTQQAVDAGVAPVQQDLQAVGALLSQVTEAVSDTDHRLATLEAEVELITKARAKRSARGHGNSAASKSTKTPQKAAKSDAGGAKQASDAAATKSDAQAQADAQAQLDAQAKSLADERAQALKRRVTIAVEKERYEITLQSIVTLPLRKARGYAVDASLVLDGVGRLEPMHAKAAVEAAELAATHDKAVLVRAMALAHKFNARESSSIVFLPLSASALVQNRFADWLVDTLGENRELAGQLVLEFTQKDVRSFSPIEFDLLQSVTDLGFRMSVTQLSDARSDVFDLARRGFRYAKAPVALFLGTQNTAQSDIHPEDLADLAARNGMDLIVDQVESESQVVELLDHKLKYGQGNLFARPRVVDVEPLPEKLSEAGSSAKGDADATQEAQRPVARALSKAV